MADVSKFGGVPVGETPKSKFGGVSVDGLSADLPAYGDNAAWAAKTGQDQNPGFLDKGGTVDRVIQGTGLSNIPHDLSESASRFMDNPTPGNIPIIGPSIDSATRLLTGRSANPLRDIPMSVPGVGPMAVQVGDNLNAGKYPEAFGGTAALLAPVMRGEMSPGLRLADGDIPTPGIGSRLMSATKAAGPDIGKGLAKVGAGAAAFELIPGEAGRLIVGYPLVKSGAGDVGRGLATGRDVFRGPMQGPEVAPKGFQSPYPTLPYEKPLPALGPRPPYRGEEFIPRTFEDTRTSGTPGGVLPSGRVVGPAPPSRINPPEPRGSGPRVPGWQQMPITGERPLPASEFSPTYPSTPILESGRVIGPRPTLDSPPNGATVVNGPQLVTSKVATAPVSPAPLQSFGVPRIGQTAGERIAAISQSPEGTVGTRAEMMRQLRLADQSGASAPEKAAIIRRFEAPEYTQRPDRPFVDPREPQIIAKPLPSLTADTPATVRARANASRAKFDENGKRNQLK